MNETNDNKRVHARHRVLKEGIVAINRDNSTMPCQIRDISASGAKLRVEDPGRLPRHFHLHIPVDGVKYAVEVRWLQSFVCGVAFHGEAERTPIRRYQHLEPTRADGYAATVPVSRPGIAKIAPLPTQGQKKAFGRRLQAVTPDRESA